MTACAMKKAPSVPKCRAEGLRRVWTLPMMANERAQVRPPTLNVDAHLSALAIRPAGRSAMAPDVWIEVTRNPRQRRRRIGHHACVDQGLGAARVGHHRSLPRWAGR